jgi:hypothetical protein
MASLCRRKLRPPRPLAARVALAPLIAAVACLAAAAPAAAAPSDPLFVFTPLPVPPPALPVPPPTGYFNDPCGLAVDSLGRFYVADYEHDAVDVYDGNADYTTPPVLGSRGYLGQLRAPNPSDGPCGLAFDSSDRLYVNEYHRSVLRYGSFGAFGSPTTISGAAADGSHPTGIAVNPAASRAYVDERDHVSVFEEDGRPVMEESPPGSGIEVPLEIGLGSIGEGYGVAVSSYPGTAGYLYVPDAATRTVKVYDPATPEASPVATIAGPPDGFSSLRDAAVSVDRATGEVYVLDDLQPENTVSPHGLVDVFDSTGAYEGHLKYEVVDGDPSGLAVDNSATGTQGRVYVTSGNRRIGTIYAYPPGAATTAAPLRDSVPPSPPGGESLFPATAIGGASSAHDPQIACEGDACQILPPEPIDPALGTQVAGLGNPRVHYHGQVPHRHRHRHRQRHRHHHRGHRPFAAASTAQQASAVVGLPAISTTAASPLSPAFPPSALPPLPGGFAVDARADGDATATVAGSHPYSLDLSLGLSQASGEADLRGLSLELPPDLFLDPAATALCAASSFATPRSSPYEASKAGERCEGRAQIGTLDAENGSGEVRSFGLFALEPSDGDAARFGAAPFGSPIVFDVKLLEGAEGSVHFLLESTQVAQGLALHGLSLSFWGAPWDTSHDGERGNCLNEAEPSFPWAKCDAIGDPVASTDPVALLTLPTECDVPLAFSLAAASWSGSEVSEQAVVRDAGGAPALLEGCSSLHFEPPVQGTLSTKHVSSPAGFVMRLGQQDLGFINPRGRAEPRARSAVVELPRGVTLNPSLGAGLEGCTPGQFAAETSVTQGCPNGSKIGSFDLRFPFYKNEMKGALYLAKPRDNPYGSLIAVYLAARAADRGVVVKARGKLTADPADGTLTARFDGLTQLPYTELHLELRAGQRAAFVSPPSCGLAPTRIALSAWSDAQSETETESPLEAGIEGASCPTGTPPFAPRATAGGVNSNANSYTPYFIHIFRSDPEQEITSYSLVLPKGITGKLAGIPFCPDAAISAARERDGFAEAASPSCPTASQVGRTLTGYGVGPSLTYSEGEIYLAGPYHGSPLSLVTINPATVGPFDLGTIVVRSAFDLDPLSAQLRIDSRASDPIPHILDGVVLHLRDIRVYLDRPQFTHNPTSCESSQLESTLTGSGGRFGDPSDDVTATATSYFQLLNCRNLDFRPKLGLRLLGKTTRGGFPALRASFRARGPRDSNLRRIEVDMPHQLFLAQNHIRGICTRPQFDAERCPSDSVYGSAAAFTPLLDQPLRGDVFLRSSDNRLPALVANLRSGSIRIVLEGRIGPTKAGGIQVFFDDLPDAAIERFTMLLRGGREGLLTNSVNVCARPPTASVKALAQNNVGAIFTTPLRGRCGVGRHHAGRAHQGTKR